MKELTNEEKAKAYDEALEKARKLKEDPKCVFYEYSPKEGDTICDYIFPELKEPEDERVRKSLIGYINGISKNEVCEETKNSWIAWLEKQGTPNQTSIWKHWKDGICGNGEGKQIYLIKNGDDYSLSSSLGYECDYILLSDLDKLMLQEKQGKQTLSQTNERAWLYLVDDVLTWREGIGQYLDNPKVQELAKKLQKEYGQKLYIEKQGGQKPQRMISAEAKEALHDKPVCVWSKEDEEMCQETIDWFEKKCFPYALENDNPARESIRWLKFLKDRYTWKPNLAQLNALSIVSKGNAPDDIESIVSLYNDLKKLKGE